MSRIVAALVLVAALSLSAGPAWAQAAPGFSIITEFPAQAVGVGDSVTLRLTLRARLEP